MKIVEAENIEKSFRKKGKQFHVLKNVSLSVEGGEIFGLLGPNGAGKTTLMHIMIGMLLPDKGGVKLFGKELSQDALEKVSLVSAETRFHWALNTKDIMDFYGRIYGIDEKTRKRKTEQLVRFFGLKNTLNQKFYTLSTGERMRLILAKALINDPKLLILDEPTVGLDPEVAIRVRDEIIRVNREFGTTIILTSHYMQEVEQLADRIAFLHKGEILDTGTVEKVKLRKFRTYDVIITAKNVKNRNHLRKKGFTIRGRTLKKTLNVGDSVNEVLSVLSKNGIDVTDVETRKPSLEDYFVKIAKRGNK